MADDEVTFRSLYRRFRPQRFADVRGQDHIVLALSNAVRDDRVGHAYLFSGPRGTGKTSTARILAKALNCDAGHDGEPCGVCASCRAVERGTSLDVHELDAASNNGVDAMRDLVSRAALGTPGRHKVYIVDEVHMLSTAASNALLKTLEEPPNHVIFVLATTDPQKVLPTIRSRTQHFEFRLLTGDVLSGLLADVNEAAGLGVAPEAIDLVVRRGKGSARDALSVLDQVAAAGEVDDEAPVTDDAVEALCERDAGRALVAVAMACGAGRDPRRLAADLVDHLRNAFLLTQAPSLVAVPDEVRDRLAEQAHRLGPAAMVRGIETLGHAQIDMRDALDPRIVLEAALVRLARPDVDTSPAAIVERLERLERLERAASVVPPSQGGDRDVVRPPGGERQAPQPPPPPPPPPAPPPRAPSRSDEPFPAGPPVDRGDPFPAGPGAEAGNQPGPPPRLAPVARGAGGPPGRAASPPPPPPRPAAPPLPGRRAPVPPPPAGTGQAAAPPAGDWPASPTPHPPPADGGPASPTPHPPPSPSPPPPPPPGSGPPGAAPTSALPTRDALTKAWGDSLLTALSGRAKARFGAGRFRAVEAGAAVFALPNSHYLSRCEEVRPEVEAALAAHFGVPVPLRLVMEPPDASPSSPAAPKGGGGGPPDDSSDLADLRDFRDQRSSDEPPPAVTSPEERVRRAFPGAEEVTT